MRQIRGCKENGQTPYRDMQTGEATYRCPKGLITEATIMGLWFYKHLKEHHKYVWDADLINQPNKYLEAMSIIEAEVNAIVEQERPK